MAEATDKSEKDDWKTFSADAYRKVAANLVHFSAKGVNSNAESFGVRLGKEAALPLPYISARCLMRRGVTIPVDYLQNPGGGKMDMGGDLVKIADVMRQIRHLQTDEHGQTPDVVAPLQVAVAAALDGAYEDQIGGCHVSPRLRQLLLPKGDGYVAITPLPSGGLSQVINQRVQAHNEAVKAAPEPREAWPLRLGGLGVGGSNPQNVGSLVRNMQTVLTFTAPTEDRATRAAFAIHFKGVSPIPPRRLMMLWRDWRKQAIVKNGGQLPTDMEARQAEQTLLENIARAILRQGEKARRRLEAHSDILGDALLSDELQDELLRGLIDPAERGKDWPRLFGEQVAAAIGRYSIAQNPRDLLIPLDQASLDQIAHWIEEAAR